MPSAKFSGINDLSSICILPYTKVIHYENVRYKLKHKICECLINRYNIWTQSVTNQLDI